MDTNVGKVLKKLEELKIADNTIVIFTSDNGAAYEGYIGDLKGGKTDLHDGGIRVPMIARWPAAIKAGTASEAIGHSNDLLPTFCEAAGIELSDDMPLDGLSLLPHLKGAAPPTAKDRGTLLWQLNLYKKMQRRYPKPEPYATEVAIQGKWKLLARDGNPVELFNIEDDPNELRNLMSENPAMVSSLRIEIEQFLKAPRTPQE